MPKRSALEEPNVQESLPPSQVPSPPRKRSKQNEAKEEDTVVDVGPDSGPTPEEVAGSEHKPEVGSKGVPEEGSAAGSKEGSDASNPGAASDTCGSASRDPDYYFKEGNVIVRVGDVLFKIHTSPFEARSTVFKDIFHRGEGDVESTNGDESDESAGDDSWAEGEPGEEGEEEEEEEEGGGESGEGESAEGEEDRGEEVDWEGADGGKVDDDQESESDEETEPHTAVEGTRDSIPILISGVTPSEFRNLLKIFYCLQVVQFAVMQSLLILV